MEPVTTVVDKLKGLAKSTEDLAQRLLDRRRNANHRSPIEILKRLQREAFSDIMKLRDRQEKVEKLLTFYKSSKGSPFQEASTHVKGKVDIQGAFFIADNVDEHKHNAIQKSGLRTGIDAKLIFETAVGEKDALVAEFVASEKGRGDVLGGPLSLAKIFYAANVSDWFSAVAVPMGALCRDVSVSASSHQERAITEYSEFGPPLLSQHNGSGIGVMVKKSNMVASLAQFVNPCGVSRSLSTFGEVVWELSRNTKLSVLGVHSVSRSTSQNPSLGALTFPISVFQRDRFSEEDSPTSGERRESDGSIAVMMNREFDENSRIGGWIETKNSNPRNVQWAVTMRDTPEDELGWGLTLGGSGQCLQNLQHFQIESFFNFNVGKNFKLQPAFMYVNDGGTQFPALMLRSSWSL
ncbi:hypothetical protein ABFS83_03G080400 [Erythranthe nasuta]